MTDHENKTESNPEFEITIYPNCILAEESFVRLIRGRLSDIFLNLFFLERRPEFATLVLFLFFRSLKNDIRDRLGFFAEHLPGFDYTQIVHFREIEKLERRMIEKMWPLYERIRQEKSFPELDRFVTDYTLFEFEDIGHAVVWITEYANSETTRTSPHVLSRWSVDAAAKPWQATIAFFLEEARCAILTFSADALPHYLRLATRLDYLTQRNAVFIKTTLSPERLEGVFPMAKEAVVFDVFPFDETLGLRRGPVELLDINTAAILLDQLPTVSSFIDQNYIVHSSYSWSQRGPSDFTLDLDRPSFGALCPLLCYPIIEKVLEAVIAANTRDLPIDPERPSCFLEPCNQLIDLWFQNDDSVRNVTWPPQFSLAETESSFGEGADCCVLTQNLLPTKLAACARRLIQITYMPPLDSQVKTTTTTTTTTTPPTTFVRLLEKIFDENWADSGYKAPCTRYLEIITCLLSQSFLIPPAQKIHQATIQFLNLHTNHVHYELHLSGDPNNETRFSFAPEERIHTDQSISPIYSPPQIDSSSFTAAASGAPSTTTTTTTTTAAAATGTAVPTINQATPASRLHSSQPMARKSFPLDYLKQRGIIKEEKEDEDEYQEELNLDKEKEEDLDEEYSESVPETKIRRGKGKALPPKTGKVDKDTKAIAAKATAVKGRKSAPPSISPPTPAKLATAVVSPPVVPPKKRKRVDEEKSTAIDNSNTENDTSISVERDDEKTEDASVLDILPVSKRRKLQHSLLDNSLKWGIDPVATYVASAEVPRTRPRRR